MKENYLRKLYKKYFIGQFPDDFLYQGHLIYHKKFEYILRGFCFENSAFEGNAFNMSVFVQPLYIPSTYLWFNFGKRLGQLSHKGSDHWWTITPENEKDVMSEVIELMKGPGLRFLEKIQSPSGFIKAYGVKQIETPRDYNVVEALAYAHVLNQEYQTSRKSLLRLVTTLKAEIERNPQIKWLSEILSRSSMIYDLVSQNKLEESINLLRTWSKFTIEALKLKANS